MSVHDAAISDAWQQASLDLGIRVIAPYAAQLGNGRTAHVEAYLPDFGSQRGAAALSQRTEHLAGELKRSGFWLSVLFDNYRLWNRQLFIDTLNDWGWFGQKDQAPIWYTGTRWS